MRSWPGGKQRGQHAVVLLVAGVARVPVPEVRAGAAGRRRPMVAVGHVQQGHARERVHEAPRLRHPPHRVRHPVVGGEVVERRRAHGRGDQRVDVRAVAVGEEDRLRLALHLHDVPRPVVLLVRPGPLVLADPVVVVLVHRAAPDDPGLLAPAHPQPVDVQRRLALLGERYLPDESLQVLPAPGVDGVGVHVDALGQVDLRTDDVQERARTALGHRPRLRGVDHVVGNARHLGSALGGRPPRPERMQSSHDREPDTGRPFSEGDAV